jgi:hypothetical protein
MNTQDILQSNAVDGFKMALVQARIISASGGKGNAKDINALVSMRHTIVDLISKDYWTVKKANFLVSLVAKYNTLAGTVRQQVNDDKLLEADPNNWLRTGRQVIDGTVKTVKDGFNDFGYFQKMLVVTAKGQKIWSSVPSAMHDKVAVGDQITYTVTVKLSDDSKIFGFGSRPTKLTITSKGDNNEAN